MSLPLRLATPADIPALVRLGERAYAPYVARLGGIEPYAMRPDLPALVARGAVRVAEEGGTILGYLIDYADGDAWMLENLAVDPRAQRRGLGRALLAAAEAAARAAGAPAIRLYTNVVMTENQALYLRLGYRETGRDRFGEMHRVHYEKPLG